MVPTTQLGPGSERMAQGAVLALMALFALAYFYLGPALAGTDTTFDTATSTVAGYINGSAGKLAALVALGYGVIRMATSGWSLGHVGVPIAVGISAGIGGPIVQSSVTAII
ncbi:membrane protein [Parvularcula oceani]|uniref:membrane protein n=1 Tax=Parvularcula oceani TaxID=1247963 RepID=UPI000562D279|nr:membrane protein [Parvularcula oceani]